MTEFLPHQELGRKVLVTVEVAVRYAAWFWAQPEGGSIGRQSIGKCTSQDGDSQVWPCRFRVLIRQI
jgi:hypothetical protein